MVPGRRRPRGRGWPFGFGFFDEFMPDFDEEFRQMEENMAKIFEDAMKRSKQAGEGKPYVYGFSMRVGPDGKPHIEEFGNVPGVSIGGPEAITAGREPLTDVIEKEDAVDIIAELPGIEKKDINLEAGEKSLTIDVNTPDRKYHKELELPCEVKPDVTKATFKNGILEVKLPRVKKKAMTGGFNVKID